MGLKLNEERIYLSFQEGKLERFFPNYAAGEAEKAEKVVRNGKEYYVKKYTELEGFLKNIYFVKMNEGLPNEYIKVQVLIEDKVENQLYVVILFMSQADYLLRRLGNINKKKVLTLKALKLLKKNDKMQYNYYLLPYQNGKKIEDFWKDELPKVEEKIYHGRKFYERSKRDEFLINFAKSQFVTNNEFASAYAEKIETFETGAANILMKKQEEEEENLPF